MKTKIVLALGLMASASPIFAQEALAPAAEPATVAAGPATAVPVTKCELHVWPAERFSAMTTGWLGGGLIDAAIHAEGDKSRKSQMASALDPDGQSAALGQADLVATFALQPSKIIVHPAALDRKTINKISTRRADSSSPCYAELIVADVFYQKSAIYGRSLRTLFMYRDFGTANDKPKIYKSWGGNGLKLFPAKAGDDVEAANAELVSVFKKNFDEFGRNYQRVAKR
jgi:hypothetical protein